jgi:hypothetical protein
MKTHKYSKRDNSSHIEIRGFPMWNCSCGKNFQTKKIAEKHCIKENKE